MKQKTGYVAFDGQFFETESDCIYYEENQIFFFGLDYNGEVTKDPDDWCIVAVKNPDFLPNTAGLGNISYEGVYFYEAEADCWTRIDPTIGELLYEKHDILKNYYA